MLQCSIIVRVVGHPQLWPSLPSWTENLQHCPARPNRVHQSTHASLIKLLFHFTAIRSNNRTSEVSRILIPRLASSTTCKLQPLRNQIVVARAARVLTLAFARRLPKSLAATGPVACRCGSVYGRWAIFSRATTSHSVTEYAKSGRGDETPLPARATHWEHTGANLHPRMVTRPGEYNWGRGNATTTPSDVYYIL